jgi:predicted aspartyl protease
MPVTFVFKKEKSSLLGTIYRPIATVLFQDKKSGVFKPVTMIIDTGADYTLLPRFLAPSLGIDLNKDCQKLKTSGVGGEEIVFFSKEKITVRLGDWERKIPLGFLNSDFIPPLLGKARIFSDF